MRRRRRSSSPLRAIILWSLSLALIGWGFWQAVLVIRTLYPNISTPATTPTSPSDPDVMANGQVPGTNSDAQSSTEPADIQISTEKQTGTGGGVKGGEKIDTLLPYPTFDPALSSAELIAQGTQALEAGQILTARFALNQALARTQDEPTAAEIRSTLAALNMPIFLSGDILPDDPAARMVEILDGDNFYTLARAYEMPVALLHILNPSLDPGNLKTHTGIKIVQGPFHARISKQAQRLDLYARDIYVASCRVDFPEGNVLPKGDYQIAPGTKLQLGPAAPPASSKTWIGFQGLEPATETVTNGWLFGAAGPRGTDTKNRTTGIHLADADLQQLFNTLTESWSHLYVEP